jgi:acyl carrier protein
MIKEKILQFMKEDFLLEFSEDVTEVSDLFKLGIIDSVKYIKLIGYLEQEFGLTFSEEEILSNVFVSLASIVDCISRKVQRKS